jgi:iron complex outermembrane receptor protein
LLGARAGDSVRLGNQRLNLYAGVRNVLDEDYFSNVRINANANRPIEDRGYFEPGAGRTFYAGIELTF